MVLITLETLNRSLGQSWRLDNVLELLALPVLNVDVLVFQGRNSRFPNAVQKEPYPMLSPLCSLGTYCGDGVCVMLCSCKGRFQPKADLESSLEEVSVGS